MKSILVLLATLATATPAMATSYVICGTSIENADEMKVKGFELALSSEDEKYSGAVGGNWNLKLGSVEKEWLAPNKNITARKIKTDEGVNVEVTIQKAQTATGPVGNRYVLKGLYDDQPVLEKYTMGGFTGSVKTGTFKCVGSVD